MKQLFKHTPPVQQLLLLVIVTFSCWFVISFAGTIVAMLFWGHEAITNTSELLNNIAFLKYFQVVQSIGLFIIPPILFEFLTCGNIALNHFRKIRISYTLLALAILAVIAAQPFISLLGVFNNGIEFPDFFVHIEEWMRDKEADAQRATEVFLSASDWPHTLLNAIIIAVIPAIGEELMFRGSLQRVFQTIFKNKHLAVIITAVLFSAIHVQFFGFLPRFVLGVIFGYLMVYGKNIWLPIIAHFTNNFMAFIIYQSYTNDNITKSNPLDAGHEYPDIIWVIFSLLGTIAILYLCHWIVEKKHTSNSSANLF
ncbi:lysostaphin resistance A-like protein [Saccharicrinis sp. 156]|uniref:CPBP family intramembrane glutamic endopeptidase n=1 Tax=Saccharicrinis sp. 156 TaxID=3417574 RepID=UPI003D353F46